MGGAYQVDLIVLSLGVDTFNIRDNVIVQRLRIEQVRLIVQERLRAGVPFVAACPGTGVA